MFSESNSISLCSAKTCSLINDINSSLSFLVDSADQLQSVPVKLQLIVFVIIITSPTNQISSNPFLSLWIILEKLALVCIVIKNKIIIEVLPQSRADMLDPERKKEMMEGIVTEIMARMKAQGMSQDDILATIEKISKQGIEEEEE